MNRFYVTTPIYYVNAQPHIGHAYTTTLADVLARYHRLAGAPTFFLTGTDEHGQKVALAAEKGLMTPQKQADETVVRFQQLWKKLEITNDDFLRTTEERHKAVVRKLLQDLYDSGEIYRAEYDGWYCVACERFYTEKDLLDGKCPEPGCGRTVDRITEANYFFRMSKYQDWLISYINEHPKFILPEFRRNETLGFLRKKLNDLCISRPKSRMAWGIELPFDPNFVTYVWFDALVNYISAIGCFADESMFRKWWPASCQLIGKDILTTHTVYWPTMLKAAGLPMPETIFAHGWWLAGESKMSKTAGNVVDPMAFADKYGVDAFRYFLIAAMIMGEDAIFSEEAFVRRYNADLANDLGNLLSRVMKMITTHCGGRIPSPGPAGPEEDELRDSAIGAAAAMCSAVKDMRIDLGIGAVNSTVRMANRYLEKKQPWTLASGGRLAELGTVLYSAAETLRIASGLLYPVMPSKMAELRETLGIGAAAPDLDGLSVWGKLPAGASVGKAISLFPRIEMPRETGRPGHAGTELVPALQVASAEPHKGPEGVAMIEYADFEKVHLRTAKILVAEKVAGADKLLRLEVEVGSERRQIVAGIAQHYRPEDLPGKTIVIVANLKPRKMKGVESNGMLLAASTDDNKLRLVTVESADSGCVVK
ncbi:MAG: methionine--tRNA ligase [bacterium]